MRMRNPRASLALLLSLAVVTGMAACGSSDDKKEPSGGDKDAGSGGGDGGPAFDLAAKCPKGHLVYDGHTGQEIADHVAAKGACVSDADVAELCATNPSREAGESGKACYINGLRGEELRTCTVDGDEANGIPGIRSSSPNLSDGCMVCYADAVSCSAEKCSAPCLGFGPTSEECVGCREDEGCTPAFYECAGLPRETELK